MKGKSPLAGGTVGTLLADRHYPTEIRSGARRSMELPEVCRGLVLRTELGLPATISDPGATPDHIPALRWTGPRAIPTLLRFRRPWIEPNFSACLSGPSEQKSRSDLKKSLFARYRR